MCSVFVRTVYFLCLVIAIGLIVASVLTPAWRNLRMTNSVQNQDASLGLLSVFCGNSATPNSQNLITLCAQSFDEKQAYEKAALIFMGLSLVFCVLALLWSIVFCVGCCFKSCLAPPLPVFSGLAAVSLSIAVGVYVGMSKDNTTFDKWIPDKDWTKESDFGVSMWLAVGAIALLVVDTIAGIILVTLHDNSINPV